MISFLKGDVVEINADYIQVDVNGVGFQVYVGRPESFSYGRSLIYTYLQVRDDGMSLFGFNTKQEQDLFLRLINVSGIGPKTALGMLGACSIDSLIGAIELGNVAFLKKLPSIGPKAAQQIILDLKGKLVADPNANKPSSKKDDKYSDVYDALRQFGFKVAEIDNVINKVEKIETKQISEIIRDCLKMLKK